MKVGIQGIPGSFHHQVALNCFGETCGISGYRTFEEVARSVNEGKDDVGVMAIENSIAGAILPNYELIDRYGLTIIGEYYLPISHNLMAFPGQQMSDIQQVKSHPMALLQCKKFFEAYPLISLMDDVDTASVAKRISDEKVKGIGAIASTKAAEIYGLEILAYDIQTVKDNFTRFILLKKQPEKTSEMPDKASIKVTIRNEKGSLAKLLSLLSDCDMDLSKIQSVPVMDKPWNYAFFLDMQFADYDKYQEALKKVVASGGEVKMFGEYLNKK